MRNIGLYGFFSPDNLLGIQTMALSEKDFFVMLLGGNVHIVPEPCGQGDMPAAPEPAHRGGEVRAPEILGQRKTHHPGSPYRDVGVPREIAVDLEGEQNRGQQDLQPGITRVIAVQAIGYLADVRRGEVAAERNFLRYALFLSFFPQLVAGPIERRRKKSCPPAATDASPAGEPENTPAQRLGKKSENYRNEITLPLPPITLFPARRASP